MLKQAISEVGEFTSYSNGVYRIVETQEYAATTGLVDNHQQQDVLEQMLDGVKPDYREGTQSLHYLISTPFRYPPLKYGSRFGDTTIPSYFYASEQLETALAEFAFYRFAFFNDMTAAYDKSVSSEHMSFSVEINSAKSADLTRIRSSGIYQLLTSPLQYHFTQQVGKALIENGALILRYYSARCDKGINVAISRPEEITSSAPQEHINWICLSTATKISINAHGQTPRYFEIEQFLIDGVLPRLA